MASRRTRRREVDWDYNKLHRTGKRVPKTRNITKEDNMSEDGNESDGDVKVKGDQVVEASIGGTLNTLNLRNLTNNEAEFYEEITEFFDENKVAEALRIEEIDDMSSEIKNLRRAFRRAHRELKDSLTDYDTRYGKRFEEQCKAITEYIAGAKKEKKKRLDDVDQQRIKDKSKEKEAEENKEKEIKRRKVSQETKISDIKAKELDEKIKQIESSCKSVDNIGDDEILELKNNVKTLDNELRDLRDMWDRHETSIFRFCQQGPNHQRSCCKVQEDQ